MITRRDVLVALVAAGLTAGGFALAEQGALMHSTAIDWNTIPAKANDSGSVRTFFRSATPTLKELEVHVTTLDPGKAPHAPHRHPNEELLIIKQGAIEALIGGEWKKVGPGSVVFFASNELHGVRNAGNEQAVYHVIGFKTDQTPEAPPAAPK